MKKMKKIKIALPGKCEYCLCFKSVEEKETLEIYSICRGFNRVIGYEDDEPKRCQECIDSEIEE